jgi:hypothetical protein
MGRRRGCRVCDRGEVKISLWLWEMSFVFLSCWAQKKIMVVMLIEPSFPFLLDLGTGLVEEGN